MMHFVALGLLLVSALAHGGVVPQGLVPKYDGRVYGGWQADFGQFPYTASMRFFGLHRCGAVLYRPDAVLTAAHCVHGLDAGLMEISMGTVYRNRGGEERWVKEVISHEDFIADTFENDIAIIVMQSAVPFSETIQPIALASVGEQIRPGTLATITGWGSLNDEGHLPDRLQYVRFRIVDRNECVAVYDGLNVVTSGMICAGEPEGGKDACNGDSGGPLVVANKVYGLVSWGDDCGKPGVPGVYTSVASHREWIEAHLGTK